MSTFLLIKLLLCITEQQTLLQVLALYVTIGVLAMIFMRMMLTLFLLIMLLLYVA